jgi:hypothetical protein
MQHWKIAMQRQKVAIRRRFYGTGKIFPPFLKERWAKELLIVLRDGQDFAEGGLH